MSYFTPPKPDYDSYSVGQVISIPSIILVICILLLVTITALSGVPVERGVTFTGGTELRIDVSDSVENPESELDTLFNGNYETLSSIPASDSYILTFGEGEISSEEADDIVSSSESVELESLSEVSPSLGSDAQITAIYGLIIAFALMSLFVIAVFRSVIPAFVIILSAVSNILIATVMMNVFNVVLSLGTVGALLMLIGYSVDSDILLNNYVLKRDGKEFVDRVHNAMRTGVTMTVTSLSAMIIMYILATVFGIGLLADMGFVLAVGLIADLMNTYMMNVGILKWYVSRGDST